MVDIDNTIADYTNGLRDYIRECGHGEDECPCPEPTAYDFTLTGGWPFSGDPKAFTWWHTRAVADGLYSREEPYAGAAEALNQLHDAGWNVIMATSRADDWRGESQRWLHRNGFQFDGSRIRLSRNELGDLAAILQSITSKKGERGNDGESS